jgi:hypothetical protein
MWKVVVESDRYDPRTDGRTTRAMVGISKGTMHQIKVTGDME